MIGRGPWDCAFPFCTQDWVEGNPVVDDDRESWVCTDEGFDPAVAMPWLREFVDPPADLYTFPCTFWVAFPLINGL